MDMGITEKKWIVAEKGKEVGTAYVSKVVVVKRQDYRGVSQSF